MGKDCCALSRRAPIVRQKVGAKIEPDDTAAVGDRRDLRIRQISRPVLNRSGIGMACDKRTLFLSDLPKERIAPVRDIGNYAELRHQLRGLMSEGRQSAFLFAYRRRCPTRAKSLIIGKIGIACRRRRIPHKPRHAHAARVQPAQFLYGFPCAALTGKKRIDSVLFHVGSIQNPVIALVFDKVIELVRKGREAGKTALLHKRGETLQKAVSRFKPRLCDLFFPACRQSVAVQIAVLHLRFTRRTRKDSTPGSFQQTIIFISDLLVDKDEDTPLCPKECLIRRNYVGYAER